MPLFIELENYQGPFDVLLELLNRRQLDIAEVSLAKITDDYLHYIADLELSLEEMNWFLFVATKLTFDKSQAILAIEAIEEEIDLTESLRQYAIVKDLATQLTLASRSPHYVRPGFKFSGPTQLCRSDELVSIFNFVQRQYNNAPKSHTINSRSDQLKKIRTDFIAHIRKLKSFSNGEIIDSAKTRTEAALYLLTLLDMLRTGDITIIANQPGVMEAV